MGCIAGPPAGVVRVGIRALELEEHVPGLADGIDSSGDRFEPAMVDGGWWHDRVERPSVGHSCRRRDDLEPAGDVHADAVLHGWLERAGFGSDDSGVRSLVILEVRVVVSGVGQMRFVLHPDRLGRSKEAGGRSRGEQGLGGFHQAR
jgi:hypothetical protein